MILITGSGSLTGKTLLNRLIQQGQKVRCLDFEKPKVLPKGVDFITGDVLDEALLKKACHGVTDVFHFMDIKDAKHYGRRYMKKINIRGTENLLFAAARAKVGKFMFLSSYEIYGRSKKIPIRQDDRKKPVTRYGKDKLKAEKICNEYIKKGDMAITIIRPALTIGPGTDNPIILITLLMALGMADANRMYISGNGDNRFQLIHPDDVVEALLLARESEKAAGKVYNLGSDNVPTQMEQVVKMMELAKLDCTIRHLSPGYTKFLSFIMKPFKVSYLNKEHLVLLLNTILMDCQVAKDDLGWEPVKTNLEILLETIKWYKEEKL